MKAILFAMAILVTGVSGQAQTQAQAEVDASVDKNAFLENLDAISAEAFMIGYTCTTRSRGVTYTSNDRDFRTAERNAVTSCIRAGGDRFECQQNVYCVERGNPPGRPPRDPYPPRGSHFDWGTGSDGYGYCYEWAWNGTVLNGGRPQPNFQCEAVRPSYYAWGRGRDGYTYCYQYTPYGVPMNVGRPVSNNYCR